MDDTTRTGDWKGKEWAGEDAVPAADTQPAEHLEQGAVRGRPGAGSPEPQDPDTMPEGETSDQRQPPHLGRAHWAPGERRDDDADAPLAFAGTRPPAPSPARPAAAGNGASACPARAVRHDRRWVRDGCGPVSEEIHKVLIFPVPSPF